ncbi:MAG: PAS domain S-box protein [Myxococcota bacterium]
MQTPEIPADEAARLEALRELCVLDTPPEERFDRITRMAQRLFSVPIALVSLVDAERQWFKSRQGLDATETSREVSFCGHAILDDETFVVEDAAADPRFADNPLVTDEPRIRFYASRPLHAPGGQRVGTLCVIDRKPRDLSPEEWELLRDLAAMAERELRMARIDAIREELERETLARREAEARNRRLRMALEQSPNIVLMTDAAGHIEYVNGRFEEVTGFTAAEVLGRDAEVLGSGDPEATEEMWTALAAGHEWSGLFLNRRKDGTSYWEQASVSPVFGEHGGITHFVKVARDATEQKELERRAAEVRKDERLQQFVEHTPAAVAMFDREMRYLMTSRRWIEDFGLEEAELHGRTFYDVFPTPPDDWKELHRRCLDGEILERDEEWFRHPGGSDQCIRWALHPWREDDGTIGGVAIFSEVVTERKRAEEALARKDEELHQAQKMEAVGRLAGGVAHDFNNMLSAILGFASVALWDAEEGSELHESLTEIRSAGRRAAALTRQLLAFSRKQVLDPRVLDLNPVLAGLEKMLTRIIRKDVHLEMDLGPDLPPTRIDPGQVDQVLMNLAVNAADAMPDGGRLLVRTEAFHVDAADPPPAAEMTPGDYVRLRVADEGCGMDDATLAHAFEPFFTTKRAGEGTGLGLSTVYGIVRQSGGHVAVTSAPGVGTTFDLYFPAADPEIAERGDEDDRAEAPPRGTATGTVLVVEHEPPVRKLVRKVLDHAGYRVLTAADGREALETWETHRDEVDVVLTNLVMPRLDGASLIERIQPTAAGAALVYMTGYGADVPAPRPGSDTHVGLLEKPLTPDAILETVRGAVALASNTDAENGREAG